MTVQVLGDDRENRFVHTYMTPNNNRSVYFTTDNEKYLTIPQYMHAISRQQVYLSTFASGSHRGRSLLLFLPHVWRELHAETENLFVNIGCQSLLSMSLPHLMIFEIFIAPEQYIFHSDGKRRKGRCDDPDF